MGKKDDKKLINNKILKKIQNENKETGQGGNNINNKNRNRMHSNNNRILSNQRFKRLSFQNSTNNSTLNMKKRKKNS